MDNRNSMYFVAIVLPEELNQKILSFKQYMFEKYKCMTGLKSPAHITLVPPFWMKEELQEALMHDLDRIAGGVVSFSLTTANFSSFRPSTLFIALEENEKLIRLKKLTEEYLVQRQEYKLKVENRPFHPHITIATRDLYKKSFYEAWEYFSGMKYMESWMADGICLLKHNKKNWDVVHTSQFSDIK